jgi:hypothetical protein
MLAEHVCRAAEAGCPAPGRKRRWRETRTAAARGSAASVSSSMARHELQKAGAEPERLAERRAL